MFSRSTVFHATRPDAPIRRTISVKRVVKGCVDWKYSMRTIGMELNIVKNAPHTRRNTKLNIADARLIAAAPELLEAVVMTLDYIKSFKPECTRALKIQLEQALAKAEGKE